MDQRTIILAKQRNLDLTYIKCLKTSVRRGGASPSERPKPVISVDRAEASESGQLVRAEGAPQAEPRAIPEARTGRESGGVSPETGDVRPGDR